jgi:hypothetical protein
MILKDVTLGGALSGLSAFVKQITLNVGAEVIADTRMGMTTKASEGGMKEWTGSITFKQDFADNSVDETIWNLIGTIGTFAAKPTSDAISTGNPEYTGSALFTGFGPITGAVGAQAETTVNFVSAGDLTRDVTA